MGPGSVEPDSGAPDSRRRPLLLAGGGHSHALLLLQWARRPQLRPAVSDITLVSRSGWSLYSGLVPTLVAGLVPPAQVSIDLRRLCAQADVRFVQAEIVALDPADRLLHLQGRPPLAYRCLSLDVGAVTDPQGADGGRPMAVKPLEPFVEWCGRLDADRRLRLRGGGAAAVELALALRRRGCGCVLLLRGDQLHLGSAAANRAAERMLRRAGVGVERWVGPDAPCDLLCTGSRAPGWLAQAGLPVDPASGRVLSGGDLRVEGHPELFVSGDCGLIRSAPRPPAGVWAVRAAPLLAENLRRSLDSPARPLRHWRPRRLALQLLADASTARPLPGADAATGLEALALWGPFALGPSRWLGRCKLAIDRRFMAGFQAAAAGSGPAA